MLTLAHLSDPHLPLPAAAPLQLVSKRATGWLSWHHRRRHIHVPEALAAVVADIQAQQPDHIALTGDIANISLPAEFAQAAAWLESFAPPDRLTFVPGNHDAYVRLRGPRGLGHWSAYMTGDDGKGPAPNSGFPFVRRRNDVALVGLSTAVPTAPLIAQGVLGRRQLERLAGTLDALAGEGLCRVVLIHHPPQPGGAPWRKALTDAAAFRDVIRRHGAELILHGHNHRSELARIEGPLGPVPVLGVISASASPTSPYGRAGWHRIRIEREADAWRFDVEHRAIDDNCRTCHPAASFVLHSAAAGALEQDPGKRTDRRSSDETEDSPARLRA